MVETPPPTQSPAATTATLPSRPATPVQASQAIALRPEYTNGATILMSATEIQLVFTFNGVPRQVTLLPFGVAKALGEDLNNAMTQLEKQLGMTFTNPKDMEAKFGNVSKAKK